MILFTLTNEDLLMGFLDNLERKQGPGEQKSKITKRTPILLTYGKWLLKRGFLNSRSAVQFR